MGPLWGPKRVRRSGGAIEAAQQMPPEIAHRLQVMIDLLDQHGLWRVLDYLGLGADDGNVERLDLDQLPAARQKELFWFVLDELISYVQSVHAVADEVASAGDGTPRAPAAD